MVIRGRVRRLLALASLVIGAGGCHSQNSATLNLAEHGSGAAALALSAMDITRDSMRNDVYFLSSDRLEGRGLGTPGLELAGDYIATRFAALGLKPLPGQVDYFQNFEVTTVESAKAETSLAFGEKKWGLTEAVSPAAISADKEFSGGVVFAGYGISNGQRQYDDYAGMDVKGKVVLAMRYEPHDPKTGKSRWAEQGWSGASGLESKAAAASQRGAAALLMINPPNHHNLDDDKLPAISAQMVRPANIPVLYVKRTVAAELLKAGGAPTLKELQDLLDAQGKPASRELASVSVKGQVAIKRTKKPVRNVMAMIPGTGPGADEMVVIGSHYDHLGWGGPGSLMTPSLLQRIPGVTEPTNGNPHDAPTTNPHAAPGADGMHLISVTPSKGAATQPTTRAATTNPHGEATAAMRAIHHGADDNASGTAAMLELARIYSHRPAPARTMVFVSFTAEESGLIGSAQFVNHPPIDLKKVTTMLNLDMVGRARKNLLYVGGHGTEAGLEEIIKKADADSPLEFKNIGRGGLGPSDHMSFAVKKVPVLFLFTGTHADYHKPSDTADKINYDGMADVVRFSAAVVEDLLKLPQTAYVDAADKESMSPGMGGESSGRRVTLGVVPSYAGEEDGKGVKIDGTSAGTPAEMAGLQQGDVLLSLGGRPTTTLNELTAAISALKAGDKVKVVYLREGKEKGVEVVMAERK